MPVKSAVACGAACGDAGTHNVCARTSRMSQSDDFVLITKTFGRETSPYPPRYTAGSCFKPISRLPHILGQLRKNTEVTLGLTNGSGTREGARSVLE